MVDDTPPPNRIAEWRERRGMSQETLAEFCNTTRQTISRLEKGHVQLTQKWMGQLAHALRIQPPDLLPGSAQHEQDGAVPLPALADGYDESDLFGDVFDAIARLYSAEGLNLPQRDIARFAYDCFQEVKDEGHDRKSWLNALEQNLRMRRRFLSSHKIHLRPLGRQ